MFDYNISIKYIERVSPVKSGQDRYKNQPRPIENYEPGHSSIAEKETKEYWDEVMNAFDEVSKIKTVLFIIKNNCNIVFYLFSIQINKYLFLRIVHRQKNRI